MSELQKQYEREAGIVWLDYNMTSDQWRERVEWLEAKLASAPPAGELRALKHGELICAGDFEVDLIRDYAGDIENIEIITVDASSVGRPFDQYNDWSIYRIAALTAPADGCEVEKVPCLHTRRITDTGGTWCLDCGHMFPMEWERG
jgi:hypothetical protein